MQDALMGIVILLLMCFMGLPVFVILLCVAVDWLEEMFNQKPQNDDQDMD